MVWKDLTYGSRHFWQCPQTICHFPQTMRQTIVILFNNNLQTSNFKYSKLWFLSPMVWKDLTYDSRHFWQCPQTICHFPQTMRQTIVILFNNNLQTSNFNYAKLWFLSRCNLVVFPITIFKQIFKMQICDFHFAAIQIFMLAFSTTFFNKLSSKKQDGKSWQRPN